MLLEATETSVLVHRNVCVWNIRIYAHNKHIHWKFQTCTQFNFLLFCVLFTFLVVGKFPERYWIWRLHSVFVLDRMFKPYKNNVVKHSRIKKAMCQCVRVYVYRDAVHCAKCVKSLCIQNTQLLIKPLINNTCALTVNVRTNLHCISVKFENFPIPNE